MKIARLLDFPLRHIFSLLATLVFVAFVCLVLWGYQNDLTRTISPLPETAYPASHSHIITAYHNRPQTPTLAFSLASNLTQNPIKKLAFTVLLSLKPQHTLLSAYAHHTRFGVARSLPKAARHYFGLPVEQLSIGETLLILELARHPTFPIANPRATFQRRDTLLTNLYTHNILSSSQYDTEHQKPLARAADHRPIY